MTTTTNPMSDRSGTELIRAALFARNKKVNLSNWARDVGVASSAMDEFTFGRAQLSHEALVKLGAILFPHWVYDPSSDRLLPERRYEPVTLGRGPVLDKSRLPTFPPYTEREFRPLRQERGPVLRIEKGDVLMNKTDDVAGVRK